METRKILYSDQAIQFDHEAKQLYLTDLKKSIPYKDIQSYRKIEKKGSMGKGGIARAFSSTIFGEQNFIVTSLYLEIQTESETFHLEFIQTPLRSNSVMVSKIQKKNDEVLAQLNVACPSLGNPDPSENSPSYIDELRKLKELLDEGILTAEEFDEQKKHILSTSKK
ncbi:SHOCT domain-containing protein [Alkalibacter rhizosphaerae]|uniref:SHOCT domain-containing protein n=1 Tax=Alkalibacter rhizosphaerae TaxID=2815577 RepID=A0A975AI31_9FIRM|nr:SHOCT domain-containing protein [Alkalibacter rhizosphaerae]QSX09244.1 SHOCT domain-containing protein [Alkalibacter rhizosphaerae]